MSAELTLGAEEELHRFMTGRFGSLLTTIREKKTIDIGEPIAAANPDTRFEITPPWLKKVWLDPEYEGTD